MLEACSKVFECNAPLCPFDPESLEFGAWYPDEEICKRKGCGTVDFVKTQKKIVKRGALIDRYYNLPMLERGCRICKGIKGLDPNEPEKTQLKQWFKEHQVLKKRPPTPKQMEA